MVETIKPTTREFLTYFLRLGALGFGGPIVLAANMRRDLVEKNRWIPNADYDEGLAFAQLAPGPLAAQLAMYLGWVHRGIPGATLVGITFALPSFLIVLALAALYVHFNGLPWIQGLFYGIGAAVIAIMAQGAYKLFRKTVGGDRLYWVLAGLSALTTAITESEIVWIFLGAGVIALVLKGPLVKSSGAIGLALIPPWVLTGMSGPVSDETPMRLMLFFAKAGSFVFGSGLAIVPFLHQGVVLEYQWLNNQQFLDAVAVAMITPGPVVITVAFIGFLVAGIGGATAAAVGVFLPVYLVVIFAAPYYRKFAHNPNIRNFIGGVTSAAVGAIAGAAFILGKRAIVDVPTAIIFIAALVVVLWVKRIPEPILLLAAGLIGIMLRH